MISDTHGLMRPEALRALEGVAFIIHAGDVGTPDVLSALRAVAPVIAIEGNVDVGRWIPPLPRTEVVEIGGSLLYVLHDIKTLDLDPAAAGFNAVIYGHSHQPAIETRNGILYLNPGSAGPRRFKLPTTVGLLNVQGSVLDAEIIHLTV